MSDDRRHETFTESITPAGMVLSATVAVSGFPLVGGAAFLVFLALYKRRKAREDAEDAELLDPNYYAIWSSYRAYLLSDAWQAKRLAVIERANGRCESPGCTRAACDIHHKKYPRDRGQLGNEPIEWLVALCVEHHKAKHRK